MAAMTGVDPHRDEGAGRGATSPARVPLRPLMAAGRTSGAPYRWVLGIAAGLMAALLALFIYGIASQSVPGWEVAGWRFFTSTDWNYAALPPHYGALPLIVDTLLTTAIATAIATPLAIGAALAIAFL